MIDKPLVSIGIPVYNGGRFIRKALDSLLAQDYENLEFIISDNASTDNTLQLCKEYAIRDSRIRIHRHSHNLGSPKNFQTVLEHAQGEYFMWAAVDDYWLPEFVSVLVDDLNKHPAAGVAMCAVKRIREDGTLLDTIRFSGRTNPNSKSFLGMTLALDTPLKYNLFIYGIFRARLIKPAFPLQAELCGDRRFLSQFALAARFAYVDSVLHIRVVHDKHYKDRYPLDDFINKHIAFSNSKQWFNSQPVLVVYRTLSSSEIIPWQRKLFIPVILVSLFYKNLFWGLREMTKSFILRFFPYSLQKRLLRSIRESNDLQNT